MPLREANEIESIDVTEGSRWIGWLPISVLPLTAVACRNLLPAWVFMWVLSFAIYLSLKWLTWWRARSRIAHASWRSVAYLLAWPGMDAEAFLDASQRVPPPALTTWIWATIETISRSGSALGCGAVYSATSAPASRVGGNVGSNPAASLRYFPNSRSPVAEPGCQSTSHHVCPSPLDLPG